ncbi:hypothetical protein PCANC_27040 [Puccinia coronata f. sp. avenae]|uniref:Mediator of RNA polymerase II transcription subunit 12 n=1 Tax=Puccinia coronata f. sp. avenae TaxID=200324 RepID=A0A2N5T9D7_9BASI|nr:hypothetical protein PCANC_27040 [Puccinia coronata f. sp. avenae]
MSPMGKTSSNYTPILSATHGIGINSHQSMNGEPGGAVPGRVTLNEQKQENWLRELANDLVPLLKLSRNVPHGFKGQKLLEMLNAQRNKNNLSHIRYTLAFTSDVFQFLQKQLTEVMVPLQMNPSLSTTSLITTSIPLAAMNEDAIQKHSADNSQQPATAAIHSCSPSGSTDSSTCLDEEDELDGNGFMRSTGCNQQVLRSSCKRPK